MESKIQERNNCEMQSTNRLSINWSIKYLILLITFIILPIKINCMDASGEKVPEKLVEEGETVHIPCKVLSTANSIQWFRDGKPVLLDFSPTQRRHWNLTVDGVAFVSIHKASMQDAGEWQCWHYHNNSPVAKVKVMRLIVSKPPTSPVLVLNGRSISSTANLPEYASSLFEQSSLNVNKDNSEFKSIDALVSSTSSRLSLKEKHFITVDCLQLAWTAPKHPPNWFVAGINLTEQAKLYMEFLTDQQVYKVRSSLTFNVTKEMHRGHLVCETEHANWPNAQSMATIELDVQYEPSFSISRNPEFGYHVVPGLTLTLTCDLDANPAAQTKWIRDGDKNANQSLTSDNIVDTSALNNAQLIFKEISESNSGWYKCVAEQPNFGHFESYGYFLAVRSDTNSASSSSTRQTSSSNGNNQLPNQDRLRQSNQRSQTKNNNLYNYYHDQQPTTNQQQSNQRQSQPLTNAPNTPNSASPSNLASNNVPNTNNNCDTPGKPMVVALNRTVNAQAGQEVVVAAVFCCEPKPRKVLWIHRQFAIRPSTSIATYTASQLYMASNSRNCYRSTFKIDNVKKEDSGELFFLVSNLKGLDDAFIHLNVTGGASYNLIHLSLLVLLIGFNLARFNL